MGRVSTFADPEIIQLASRDFIPVAGDDWYQRRRQDEEGAFFRGVADQRPVKDGSGNRQGVYVLTASGKLLAFRNSADTRSMRTMLLDGLRAWRKLPEAERKPHAVTVAALDKPDATYTHTPPPGGLVVNVHTRILDQKPDETFCKGRCGTPGGDQAALDHLWVTESEWKALIPASAKKGDQVAVPAPLAFRLARFHLVDNTRGEPPSWSFKEVRSLTLKLTVEEVTGETIRLRLTGHVLLTTDADPARATRGFDAEVLGQLRYNVNKRVMERFDVVVLGEHWGEAPNVRGARPGRMPLGMVFELAAGDNALDRIPPQGMRYPSGYWSANRE